MPVFTLNQVQKDQNLDPAYLQTIENLQKLMASSGAGSDYQAALNAAAAARDQAEKDAKAKSAQQANPLLNGASPNTMAALNGGQEIPEGVAPQSPGQPDVDAAVSAIGARSKNWGPAMVASIQKAIGASPDGSWGPRTAAALSDYMMQHPNAGVVPAGGSKLQFVSGDATPAASGSTASVLPVDPQVAQAAQAALALGSGATPEQAQQMASATSLPDKQAGSRSIGAQQAVAAGGSQTSKGGNQALMQDLFLQQVAGSSLDMSSAGDDAYRRELQNQLGNAALANAVAGGTNPVQTALQGTASDDRNQAMLLKARMDDITKGLNGAMVQMAAYNRNESDLRSRIYAADQRLKGMRANANAGITRAQIMAQSNEVDSLLAALSRVQAAKSNALGRLASNNLALVSPGAAQMGLNLLGDNASTATLKDLYSVGGGIVSENGLLPYNNADESSVGAGDPGLRSGVIAQMGGALGYTPPPEPIAPLSESTRPSGGGWQQKVLKDGSVGWYNPTTRAYQRVRQGVR